MTTFILTEDQAMIHDLARELAQAEIKPRSEEVDHLPLCPQEGVSILAEAGLVACMAPEELGGAGLDYWSQTCVLEEVAKECASTAWAIASTVEVAECLVKHGNETQKQVVKQLAAGSLAAPANNPASTLWAEKTPEGWLLNGEAPYVPNAGECAFYLLAAKAPEQPLWFLIQADTPGLQAKPQAGLLGFKGCAPGTLVLQGCPAQEPLAGDVTATLAAAQSLNMAAIAVGITQGALAEASLYTGQRMQFGKTIAQFENTRHTMAEMRARAEAARALVWGAAAVKDSGEDYAGAAAMAKIFAADVACTSTRKCLQFMGGYGYSREYPIERKMRDAKMTELCAGGTADQKDLISAG